MHAVSLAEAKARLSELLDRVEAGETVEITRRGKRIARLAPVDRVKEPVDVARLRAMSAGLPFDPVDTVADMRRQARY